MTPVWDQLGRAMLPKLMPGPALGHPEWGRGWLSPLDQTSKDLFSRPIVPQQPPVALGPRLWVGTLGPRRLRQAMGRKPLKSGQGEELWVSADWARRRP